MLARATRVTAWLRSQPTCVKHPARRRANLHVVGPRPGGIRRGRGSVARLPCAIGRDGITRRLVLLRDAQEQERLEKSAAVLTDAYRSLK